MNRIDRGAFLKLSVTLVAGGAGLSACSGDDDDDAPGAGGQGGAAGSGAAGGGAGSGGATGGASGSGGASGGGSGGGTPGGCAMDATLTPSGTLSHDHLPLVRPITTLLLNGAAFEFALPNEQGHIHTIAFTEAHLTSLRAGMTISITSTNDNGHTHTYDVTCA